MFVSLRPAWATQGDPASKTQTKSTNQPNKTQKRNQGCICKASCRANNNNWMKNSHNRRSNPVSPEKNKQRTWTHHWREGNLWEVLSFLRKHQPKQQGTFSCSLAEMEPSQYGKARARTASLVIGLGERKETSVWQLTLHKPQGSACSQEPNPRWAYACTRERTKALAAGQDRLGTASK
jgi:hypothetical protein